MFLIKQIVILVASDNENDGLASSSAAEKSSGGGGAIGHVRSVFKTIEQHIKGNHDDMPPIEPPPPIPPYSDDEFELGKPLLVPPSINFSNPVSANARSSSHGFNFLLKTIKPNF